MFKSDTISKDFIKFCSCLSRESVVDILGPPLPHPVALTTANPNALPQPLRHRPSRRREVLHPVPN